MVNVLSPLLFFKEEKKIGYCHIFKLGGYK